MFAIVIFPCKIGSLDLYMSKIKTSELLNNTTNKMTCVPSEDSDQHGHPSSLIRVFTVRSIGS